MNDTLTLETKSDRDLRASQYEPRHQPPLVNEPGKMLWISVRELHIDRHYQASIRKRAVARIANAWNWVACGCLSVAQRNDLGYFIFDGQHRWEAAKLRGDIPALPCIIYQLDSAAEEAAGFVATNTERRILKRIEQHNALLMIRDPIALKIDQLMREGGRTVDRHAGPTTFSAITALSRNLIDDEPAMERVWPIIIETNQGRTITGRYLDALWATERRMPPHQSLIDARWRQRLYKIGVDQIMQALRTAYLYEGRINQTIAAETVARTINRGLRSGNQLILRAEKFVRPTIRERIKAGI